MTQTIILQYQGWSYIKRVWPLTQWGAEKIVVNGATGAAMQCPGDNNWWMFEGEVASLSMPQSPIHQLSGYRLKDEYRDTTTFPRELPADAFSYDEESDERVPTAGGAYKIDFYDPLHETIERAPEPVKFVIVDRDCLPLTKPSDITVDFPASLREHPETWHKHPVSISGKALFLRAVALLRAEVAARQGDFTTSDYVNIGTLTLNRVMHHKPTEYTYHVGKKAKRASKTSTNVEILKISSPDSGYKDGALVPGAINAANWRELEPKIELFLDTIRSYVAPGRVRLCPHCDGEGFLIGDAP
jgi:hypothetical protein